MAWNAGAGWLDLITAARGGLGLDTSGSTGVPSVSAGTWSISATLAGSLGGTGLSTAAVGDLLYASATTPTLQ